MFPLYCYTTAKFIHQETPLASFMVEKRHCKFHGREMTLLMQYGSTYIITKREK